MRPLSLLVLILLSGCSLVPEYERPELDAGSSWRESAGADLRIERDWWAAFGSAELARLVNQAAAHNTDLQASLHRIEQTRARARIAGAALFPQVDLGGNLGRTRERPSRGQTEEETSYRGLLTVSYELDLWGGNRAVSRAAAVRERASRYEHAALELVVLSDTAQAYSSLLGFNERLAVARSNVKNISEVLAIIEARVNAGRASLLELSQQRSALAEAEAGIAALERQRDTALNQLAVLVGEPPQTFTTSVDRLSELIVPQITPIGPPLLLTRRPDISRVEAELAAANIDVGAARAELYPTLRLAFDFAAAANPASAPAALAGTLASSIAAPVFHGGALRGGVELSEARKDELAANYLTTVLNAFREVEDALSAVRVSRSRLTSLEIAAEEARRAYDISRVRYDAGSIDFQALLDTQRAVLQSEDALAQARVDNVTAAISLFKALGGGWEDPENGQPI